MQQGTLNKTRKWHDDLTNQSTGRDARADHSLGTPATQAAAVKQTTTKFQPRSLDEITRSIFGDQPKQPAATPVTKPAISNPQQSFAATQPRQTPQPSAVPTVKPPAAKKPPREIDNVLREALEHRESKKSGKAAVITKKQIQALTKEHLYLIILDQDDEIQLLKEDIEKMNRAFQAGYAQSQE